ncbi:hypothetical protein FVF58_12685 [Paraburkholderia panacisoli]|uniref:Uncharacterized protein n=1 Tax=Paraburkholderia panacisoli TaxID=2603818 RepID=A0A5B0HAB0_9BURK|nr:hypothetical protein FVF58_12685 [Paraburkholderia panacisoli]
MSCAARYSETTSLEFILNPFKFFFTNYVAKIAPYPPPNIPHLETKFRPPTILHAHRIQSHADVALSTAPSSCNGTANPASLHRNARALIANDPAVAPDTLSAYAHFFAERADVMRFSCLLTFFFINARPMRSVYLRMRLLHVRSHIIPAVRQRMTALGSTRSSEPTL